MKTITETGDLRGKRVLVRVDWNVPMQQNVVVNDFRIKKSLPTLEYLKNAGAQVTIATHLEQGIMDALKPFVPEGINMLSNLRDNPGEEANSLDFAKELAKDHDIFVNEAFSVSHRNHASIVQIPTLLPSYAGIQFALEIQELSKAFYPKRPFLFILGGAKFDTKFPLLKKFLAIADEVFVAGALANNFFKEQGKDIGSSLISEGDFNLKELLATGKIILPDDTMIEGDKILDVGPTTLEKLKPKIATANMILWNGPLGQYEVGYRVGTLGLAKLIAEFGKESIVGGGDTLAAISELGIMEKFTFVSTGGGAMLDFLASGTLPGIEALKATQ